MLFLMLVWFLSLAAMAALVVKMAPVHAVVPVTVQQRPNPRLQ